MKSRKTAIIIFIIAATILLSAPSSNMISRENLKREKNKIFKELRDELKEFATNEIIPGLNKWKTQLDSSMTKEDLDSLNKIRNSAADIRNQSKKEKRNFYRDRKNKRGLDKDRKKQREFRKKKELNKGEVRKFGKDKEKGFDKSKAREFGKGKGKESGKSEGQGRKMLLKNQELSEKCQSELREIIGELQVLAMKYSDVLNKIVDSAYAKKEEWKNQTENIIENWKMENKDILDEMQSKDVERRMHKPEFFNNFLANGEQERAVARFLLWDGKTNFLDEKRNIKINPEDDIFLDIDDDEFMSLDNEISNSPNPFSEKTVISFKLLKSENAKITVTDSQGKSIAVLVNGNLSKGRHDIEFNVTESKYSNLTNGTYLYKIETPSFSKTGRMILKK